MAETAVVALARPAAVCPACQAVLDGGPVVFWCPGCRRGLHAADLDVDFRLGVAR
ncbi:MAG: hypothetical protein J2P30_21360 [Actinobacteria bacterium]|nr:hypothetical protein [Actinomycetota bacterium]